MSSEIRAARVTARALGWFSIGLGLAEVLYTRRLAQAVGLSGQEAAVRACGLREIATGAAILVADRPAPFIWARVAGDVLDLGLLGSRAAAGERRSAQAAVSMVAVAGVTAVDVACARALTAGDRSGGGAGYGRSRRTVFDRAEAGRLDYASRSGFPRPAAMMRGLARDFEAPADMRTPAALRPYETDRHG